MSLGAAGAPDQFEASVALLKAAGVDSLWLPETVFGPAVDPFTGMTFALARTTHLKVGSGISVLPGRHPVLVAKQLASLAGLAPGRVLPVFGLHPAVPGERALFPVRPGGGARSSTRRWRCSGCADERRGVLPRILLHRRGRLGRPAAGQAADIWPAGSVPAGLRGLGRLGDGWLGSLSPRPRRRRRSPSSTTPPTRRDDRWTRTTSGSAWRSRSAACRTRSPPRSIAGGRMPTRRRWSRTAGRARAT